MLYPIVEYPKIGYDVFMAIFGSSFVSPAHGKGGARATIKNVSAPPPSEKICSEKQAGKKKKGCGENEFLPACSARRRRAVGWWEAARPCVSKSAKPAKIVSLIERIFCARPLKDLSIFAGFVRHQAASRGAGLARGAAPISPARKRFARSV
jgi:hypothetical protein